MVFAYIPLISSCPSLSFLDFISLRFPKCAVCDGSRDAQTPKRIQGHSSFLGYNILGSSFYFFADISREQVRVSQWC